MSDAATLIGRCHCGAVEIEIPWDGEFRKLRRCDCSYCARRWAVVASVLVGDLKVVKGEDSLSLYIWGTGTARHYFCSVCGIYTHHRRRSMPTEFGVGKRGHTEKGDTHLCVPFYEVANFPGVKKGTHTYVSPFTPGEYLP